MEWIKHHVMHLAGGGVGGVAAIGLLFREAIRELWNDYREARKAKREAELVEAGQGGKVMHELISLLRTSLDIQRIASDKQTELITQIVIANEKSVEVQRGIDTTLKDVYKRLGHIEGAHGIPS